MFMPVCGPVFTDPLLYTAAALALFHREKKGTIEGCCWVIPLSSAEKRVIICGSSVRCLSFANQFRYVD